MIKTLSFIVLWLAAVILLTVIWWYLLPWLKVFKHRVMARVEIVNLSPIHWFRRVDGTVGMTVRIELKGNSLAVAKFETFIGGPIFVSDQFHIGEQILVLNCLPGYAPLVDEGLSGLLFVKVVKGFGRTTSRNIFVPYDITLSPNYHPQVEAPDFEKWQES